MYVINEPCPFQAFRQSAKFLCFLIAIFISLSCASLTKSHAADTENNSATASSPVHGFDGLISVDTYDVSIIDGSNILNIPRNYLVDAPGDRDEQSFFLMIITRPDYTGVTTLNYESIKSLTDHAAWWEVSPDGVVFVYNDSKYGSVESHWNQPFTSPDYLKHGIFDKYGLVEEKSPVFGGVVYVGRNFSDNGFVVIKCNPPIAEQTNATCDSVFSPKPGITIDYGYNKSSLSQWRDIDSNVKALFGRFIGG